MAQDPETLASRKPTDSETLAARAHPAHYRDSLNHSLKKMNHPPDVPMPKRIEALERDPERGYPVPYFVAWVDGKPDFRIADARAHLNCIQEKLCWICGQKLGKHLAFVIGSMCVVNRVSAEPPMHRDCALYSVQVCPFLLNPNQKRNPKGGIEKYSSSPGGILIERNPGVMALWLTESYQIVRDGNGRWVLRVGEPQSVQWYAQGRIATRDEVLHSIETGLPFLRDLAAQDGASAHLEKAVLSAMKLVPL
jgi:hypothetical protein